MPRSAVSHKITKLVHSGTPHRQAVAIALNMDRRGRLGPRGGYKKHKSSRRKPSAQRRRRTSVIPCSKVSNTCNRKKCRSHATKCTAHGRQYSIPRLFSRQQCRGMQNQGFSQSASCAPYRTKNHRVSPQSNLMHTRRDSRYRSFTMNPEEKSVSKVDYTAVIGDREIDGEHWNFIGVPQNAAKQLSDELKAQYDDGNVRITAEHIGKMHNILEKLGYLLKRQDSYENHREYNISPQPFNLDET